MTKININHISKIEGHAKLHIKIEKGKVKKAKLSIFEGSRFFEGILKDKHYNDINHIASRICGICSPVHCLASLTATEKAFGTNISEQTKLLRELLNIGGTIQSHVLHLYFLALPDYTGYPNALHMAQKFPEHIKRALRIKQLGNEIVRTIGGRDIHPYAVCVGGFTRIPSAEALKELGTQLRQGIDDARKTAELFCTIDYPDFKRKTKHYALRSDKSYFGTTNKIVCAGSEECLLVDDYEAHFKEYFKQGSTAEFARAGPQSYMVGAWSRLMNNNDLLCSDAKQYFRRVQQYKNSPFMNNPAQAIEILEGIHRAIEIIEANDFKPEEPPKITPKQGIGIGALEAPRGIVFHKYNYAKDGYTTFVNITTPTTQNLPNLEEDIKTFLPALLEKNLNKEQLQLEIEKLIRAYDPCISCATHFLKIIWE